MTTKSNANGCGRLAVALLTVVSACQAAESPGAQLTLSAASVAIEVTSAAPLPARRTVEISYTGDKLDSFHASVSYLDAVQGWLDARPGGIGASGTLSLELKSTALPPGTYRATVSVWGAGDARAATLAVELKVLRDGVNPVISLEPLTVDFEASVVGPVPAARQIAITNGGAGTLDVPTLSEDAAWLVATVSGGAVTLQADPTGLAPGDYSTALQITVANAIPATVYVPISLHATAPFLAPSVPGLSFLAKAGTDPKPQFFTVTSGSADALSTPTVATSEPWLSAAVVRTGASFTVVAMVDVSGMSMGSRAAALTLTSLGALNSPLTLPVSLAVGPADFAPDASTAGGALLAIVEAYYGRLAACEGMPQRYLDYVLTELAGTAHRFQGSADAGRLTYDADAATACVNRVHGASCDRVEAVLAGCLDFWEGRVANGHACASDEECATGWCNQSDDPYSCPGSCAARKADGSACTGDAACLSGACDTFAAACVPNGVGGIDAPCGWGALACEPPLFCETVMAAGGPEGLPEFTRTCRVRRAAGETCVGWDRDQCQAGLRCADDGTCRPLVAEGERCAAAACGLGAYCSAEAGDRCVVLPVDEGESCSEYMMCFGGGLECGPDATCVAPSVPAGGACQYSAGLTCVEGNECYQGTCVPYDSADACY